jgi:predicted RNA-binding protein associated with RNAse of E/G family
MKRRYADNRQNKDILKRNIIVKKVNNKLLDGYITKLTLLSVSRSWSVDIENRTILDKDYIWLGIYPKNKNYCITAMYDNNKVLKEWYFDIVLNNGIEDGMPYEDDLYLDVVIVPDGRIHILDEDELLEARDNKLITDKEVELAYKTKDYILNKYGKNINNLLEITNQLLEIIEKE